MDKTNGVLMWDLIDSSSNTNVKKSRFNESVLEKIKEYQIYGYREKIDEAIAVAPNENEKWTLVISVYSNF